MKTHISQIIDEYKNSEMNHLPMMKFGIHEIDNAIHGFEAGELITLVGDTGSGKTSMTIRMVDSLSVDRQVPILYFCMKNTPKGIIKRLVDYRCALKREKEEDVLAEVSKAPVYLYSDVKMCIDDVCNVCRKHVEDCGVKVVFVHYMYISSYMDNAYMLRVLAKELGVTIVVLENVFECHDGIDGILPNMRDLYDSRLGEYCDTVIALCNYASYKVYKDVRGRDLRDLLYVSILKSHGVLQDKWFYIRKDMVQKADGNN